MKVLSKMTDFMEKENWQLQKAFILGISRKGISMDMDNLIGWTALSIEVSTETVQEKEKVNFSTIKIAVFLVEFGKRVHYKEEVNT